uniref:Gustatory receptor n=1 Tax=Timema genevievae TaxID=629358 RepID=A0A7R9K406_TIMGE|nr:unnamed protein product [Timema genevievae]
MMPLKRESIKLTHKNQRKSAWSPAGVVYTCSWILICLSMCYVTVEMIYSQNKEDNPNVTLDSLAGDLIEPVTTCIIGAIIHVMALAHASKLPRLLSKLSELDGEVLGTSLAVHDRDYRFTLAINVAYSMVYLVLRGIRLVSQNKYGLSAVWLIPLDLIHISVFFGEGQFASICYFIKQRFAFMNGKLREMEYSLQGMMPLKGVLKNREKVEWSCGEVFYSGLWILSCLFLIYPISVTIFYESRLSQPKEQLDKTLTEMLEPALSCLVGAIVHIANMLKIKSLPRLLRKIFNVDSKLLFTERKTHSSGFRSGITTFSLYLFLFIAIKRIRVVSLKLHHYHEDLIFLALDLILLSMFIGETQFITLSYFLKQRFTLVNVKLKALDWETLGNQNSVMFSGRRHCRRLEEDPISVHTLELLRQAHMRLSDCTTMLSEIYGVQLVVWVAVSFLQIPTSLYKLFEPTEINPWTIIAMVSWCCYFVVRFFVVIKLCSSTSDEAHRSWELVENLKQRSLSAPIMEEVGAKYDGRLNLFARHVSSQKIEFSACGFFNLDMSLMTSVLAAGVTYLVIMVQLQSQ